MQSIKYLTQKSILILLLFFCTIGCLAIESKPIQAATTKGIKIRYNKKTKRNKSKKLNIKYNSKKITKSPYKALVINKYYMAPYYDVFKTGIKASCKYSTKTKTLTIKKNGVTLKMTVGKKTAYVNDKKVKMPTAPLSVRYIAKKKTKILVPVNFVAKTLNLSYQKSSSTITLKDPLYVSYDNLKTYYTGVQGKIYYNHKKYTLKTLPVIKLEKNMYMPAEEVLATIMHLNYKYDNESGKITISNEDTGIEIIAQVDSNQITVNGVAKTINAPVKIIQNVESQEDTVCVPASGMLKYLGYTRSWNKTNKYYVVQSQNYFLWSKELTEEQSADSTLNYLNDFKATYKEESGVGSVNISLTGSSVDLMKKLTIKRSGNIITITLPTSTYLLDKNQFSYFDEIIKQMDVISNDDNTVTISLTCYTVADYSYMIQDKTLQLSVLYTYSSNSGSVISHSLSIPRPENIKIDQVTNEDLYASKKFKIKIKGDYVEYYKQNPIIINNNSIKSVSVSKSGDFTVITVKTSSIRGYKIFEQGSNFVVSMGAPKDIYQSILVLDAGHGGYDPGATNKSTDEKNLTFKIAYTLMKGYFSQNAPDIKVYWTRTTDTYVTLADRTAFAKSVGADAFISLHMNSAEKTSANGTETYYSVSNNSKSFSDITSQKMANLFQTNLINDLKLKDRGTKTAGYYVIKHNTVPAILIELGFLSGSTDYNRLTNSSFQKKAAKSIYNSIVEMFTTYPTGR